MAAASTYPTSGRCKYYPISPIPFPENAFSKDLDNTAKLVTVRYNELTYTLLKDAWHINNEHVEYFSCSMERVRKWSLWIESENRGSIYVYPEIGGRDYNRTSFIRYRENALWKSLENAANVLTDRRSDTLLNDEWHINHECVENFSSTRERVSEWSSCIVWEKPRERLHLFYRAYRICRKRVLQKLRECSISSNW